ncbi:MAG: ubiquinol-cytochrome c reductase iron-sulfur subunit [Halovenus sp.]
MTEDDSPIDPERVSEKLDDCGCHSGPAAEEPSIYQEFWNDSRGEMKRRDYAKILATVGGLTALGSLAAPTLGLSQVFERSYTGPVYSDGVALVNSDGETITENALSEGEQMTVFPESHPGIERAPTLLVRFAESEYGGETNMEFTVSGYAAYSKVCTHAGCMVADRDGTTLVCPCHSGRFDPLSGATVTGGPPPRALPQLPITLSSEGTLIATGDFEAPVGAGGE